MFEIGLVHFFIWLIFVPYFRRQYLHVAGRSQFVAGRQNNKGGSKRGARADSYPGPRIKVNAMTKEDISEDSYSDASISDFNLSVTTRLDPGNRFDVCIPSIEFPYQIQSRFPNRVPPPVLNLIFCPVPYPRFW